jgi:hypothetical protein
MEPSGRDPSEQTHRRRIAWLLSKRSNAEEPAMAPERRDQISTEYGLRARKPVECASPQVPTEIASAPIDPE